MGSMNMSLSFLVVGVAALSAGCSSGNGKDDSRNGQPQFNVGTGTNTNAGTGTNGLPAAQTTVDGLYGISSTQASALTSGGCKQWESTPQGGGSAIMEFIIDVSGSMDEDANPNNPGAGTKWEVFSQTLPGIFAGLPSTFAAGALYYNAQDGRCYAANRSDVGIASLSTTQVNALVNSVGNVQVGNYTPTYQAWNQGLQNLVNWTPGPNDPPALATAGKYIVLITDGVPTEARANAGSTRCTTYGNGISLDEYNTEIGLIDRDGDAAGVKTFVVGVIGSNDPQGADFDPLYMLSKIAVAGGTERPAGCAPVSGTPTDNDVNPRGTYCHYDLSRSNSLASDLTTALGGITSSVLSCNYSVPFPPTGQTIDPAKTTLVFTNGANGNTSLVLQNTSTTCDKGWHFTDYTNSQIEICGVTCNALQANSASALNLVFGCDAANVLVIN